MCYGLVDGSGGVRRACAGGGLVGLCICREIRTFLTRIVPFLRNPPCSRVCTVTGFALPHTALIYCQTVELER